MRERNVPPAKPPLWHRSRMGWVNALGFAMTAYLALWGVLAVFSNLMPNADALSFPFPTAFVVVLSLAHLATVVLGALIVFGFMLRGEDLNAHTPRMVIFGWTCTGLLFFLVQVVVLARFGMAQLPNASGFASNLYWGLAPLGLAAFALMAYVNVEIPKEGEAWHDEDYEDDDFDEDDLDEGDFEDDDLYEDEADVR
jgi:hypothetical protein